ncbi:reverse transcriptase domain-containing protein [Tanacetum coccineum]
MQFKYARSLTCGASILWTRSRLLEGASTFSWPLTTCLNGVKAKALPTNDARVVVKFLKSLFAQFGTPRSIISDRELFNLRRGNQEDSWLHGLKTAHSFSIVGIRYGVTRLTLRTMCSLVMGDLRCDLN